jgi:hypothetical protein
VQEHRRECRVGRELRGESPLSLRRPCCQAYARRAPPGDPKGPRRGVVALPGQPRGAGTGYIVADDLDDDGAQAVADHLDALAAPSTDILTDDFEEVLFSNAPPVGLLEP